MSAAPSAVHCFYARNTILSKGMIQPLAIVILIVKKKNYIPSLLPKPPQRYSWEVPEHCPDIYVTSFSIQGNSYQAIIERIEISDDIRISIFDETGINHNNHIYLFKFDNIANTFPEPFSRTKTKDVHSGRKSLLTRTGFNTLFSHLYYAAIEFIEVYAPPCLLFFGNDDKLHKDYRRFSRNVQQPSPLLQIREVNMQKHYGLDTSLEESEDPYRTVLCLQKKESTE